MSTESVDEHADKLTLLQLRRLRFPRGDWKDRAHWQSVERSGIHWEITFYIDGWEFGIDLAPEKPDDLDWTESEFVYMWLTNFDPRRFLVAVHLQTTRDLLRFLDAFKVKYEFIPAEEVQPVDYKNYSLQEEQP